MARFSRFSLLFLLTTLTLSYHVMAMSSREDIVVQLPKSKGTIYQLFDIITQKTGLQFVYDSNIINNEKKAKLKKGNYTIRQAVCLIAGNNNLDVRILGNHILITLPDRSYNRQLRTPVKEHDNQFTVIGTLVDKSTHKPLEAGSVRVEGSSIGSVTNSNGEFRLVLPDSLRSSYIVFSHLGYATQVLEAGSLTGAPYTIGLQERIVPLQEVVLRLANPLHLLDKMRENKKSNYPCFPVCTTTFYREGIEYDKRFVKLNEGVFKVYKPSSLTLEPDRVELLKMRNILSTNAKDSIMAKIKAGIDACLLLDIVKNVPDFLEMNANEYEFISTGITSIDDHMVNVVYFKQKADIDQPCYCGELYIDSENYALIGAQFEINPKYIKETTNTFVERKSKGMKVVPQKISYTLAYKRWNGRYYINYVRGDLHFKLKNDKRWFGSSHLHTWFEMATCKIDTIQVNRLRKKEALPRRTIFEEIHFPYDESFWENFNIIPLENQLSESIEKITLKIEEILHDE